MLTDQSLRYYRDSVAEEVGGTPTGVKPAAPGALCSLQTCCVPPCRAEGVGHLPKPCTPCTYPQRFCFAERSGFVFYLSPPSAGS